MKAPRILLLAVAVTIAGMASAWAGGRVYGGVGVGIGVGGPYWGGGGYYGRPYWGRGYYGRPYWGGGYYGWPAYPGPYVYPGVVAPYYVPQPLVVVPAEPPVYIEQGNAAVAEPAPESAQYWYFCRGANNYYPYVKECPGGWTRVPPRPAE